MELCVLANAIQNLFTVIGLATVIVLGLLWIVDR